MKAWTASAVRNYYLDPKIVFLGTGHRGRGRVLDEGGYYVAPHCDPDCCQAFGGVSIGDIGPFLTVAAARKWSVKNMVPITENRVSRRAH